MKRHRVPILFCIILLTGLLNPQSVDAQTRSLPPPPPVDPELRTLPISSLLFHFAKTVDAQKLAGDDLVGAAEAKGLLVLDSDMINVEIVNRDSDVPVAASIVRAVGGRIDATWRGQVSAWVPPDQAIDLARALPIGYLLRQAHLAHDNNEGPVTVRSDTYRDAGADGTGITIGVIDRNFNRLSEAEALGVVPIATRHNYTTWPFEEGFSVHGTAHLETVFDHAPGATYHLFRIANSTHLGLAVDDAIAEGVQILSATQSFYNEGWEDNLGAANHAVMAASDAGILYFSSSGNRALSHWQGMFDDPTIDDWLDWAPGDIFNDLIPDVPDSSRVTLYLQWERDSGLPNLEFYLYDEADSLLDSSTSPNADYESIVWTNYLGRTVRPKIAVYLRNGSPVELEVFSIGAGDLQYATSASSITSPNTNTAAKCIAVGAVPYYTYADGFITAYSSRGPTNSGNNGISIVGPTNTTTWAYGGAFGGTSCSTPNSAGAAAALWSSLLEYGPEGLYLLVLHQADLYNDWGSNGPDPVYGWGGVFFAPYAENNSWVDRAGLNTQGLPSLPWYYVQDAVDNTVDGDCLLFLDGVYEEPIIIDEPRTMKSVGESATIGGF